MEGDGEEQDESDKGSTEEEGATESSTNDSSNKEITAIEGAELGRQGIVQA